MRITLRLTLSLLIVVASVAFGSAYFQVHQERERQQDELDRRGRLLADSLKEAAAPLLGQARLDEMERLVERFGGRDRLAGAALYDSEGRPLAASPGVAALIPAAPPQVWASLSDGDEVGGLVSSGGAQMYVHAVPFEIEGGPSGALAIISDATHVREQLVLIWQHTFVRVLIQALLISSVTLLVVRWSIVGPIARIADWMKRLAADETAEAPGLGKQNLFSPIAAEAAALARRLVAAREAAADRAEPKPVTQSRWTPERIREHIEAKLQGRPLFVVSNREPYMHLHRGASIEAIVPAGGLVTALEPVMRASGGTWIAHGAGDADWEVVDEHNRVRVPPEDPRYTLKRVALTKDEESGYYYGFANEGLWPLCHITHTRPVFREGDWAFYKKANERFAEAVLEELEGVDDPFVLIQDYHFALLPRLIKERRPEARIALFWHIPWPNPEAFGICPWQKELLHGMLGADLIGFQIQSHCSNFLHTVDGALECRIDWERFAVHRGGHTTLVKPFPISVPFPLVSEDAASEVNAELARANLFRDLGVEARFLGVGVERMDYTKGILERFSAIERFLEKHPRYQGELVFVQLAAPSRTHIKRYQDLIAEVEGEAERINSRFKTSRWRPIVLVVKHHSHQEIQPLLRMADFCMVTSLHDGMNLVAKEFVASREDEDGALILSRFTGASRELRDAIIINPYDIERTAEAIRDALEMDPAERRARMRRMREIVSERNVYAWAARLITELARIRLEERPSARIV